MDSEPPSTVGTSQSLRGRIAASAALLVASNIAMRIVRLLGTILLARILLPEDFGLITLATVIIAFGEVLINLRFSSALIKIRDLQRTHFDTAFTLNSARGALLAGILLLAAPSFAFWTHEPQLTSILIWLSLGPLIDGLISPRFVLFERELRFSRDITVNIVRTIVMTGVTVSTALVLKNYQALIIGSLCSKVVALSLTYYFAPYFPRLSIRHAKELISFGGWLTLAGIVSSLNDRLDVLLVGRRLGAHEVGVFSVATETAALPTQELAAPFARAAFPAMASIIDDKARLIAAYRSARSLTIGLILPLAIGLGSLAQEFVLLLLGAKWLDVIPLIQILGPTYALGIPCAVATVLAMAAGRTGAVFKVQLLYSTVHLPLLVLGLWWGGLLGLAYARVVSATWALVLNVRMGASIVPDSIGAFAADVYRSALAAMVMSILLLTLFDAAPIDASARTLIYYTAVQVAFGAGVYGLVIAALWLIAGKPDGFERKVIEYLAELRCRFICN